MKPAVIGIDLGTTFSVVAWVNDQGTPEIVPNAEGDRITPSVILFEDGDVVVGNYAQQAATIYPDQVVAFVKRHMDDPSWSFSTGGRTYNAIELSSFLLARLKEDAEQRLGRPVSGAVITVPAYFNDIQRRATVRAGKMAGLEVLALLNEPTAAAFAYGLDHQGSESTVLVFDLGGGTFDVTLVRLGKGTVDVLATLGDHQLGGKDFDDAIIDHVAATFIEEHGCDPRTDPISDHELRARAVSAKLSLSRRPKVNLFHEFEGHVGRFSITRDDFAQMSRGLLDRCARICEQVVTDAGLTVAQIDSVLLAGGATRMPMIRTLLEGIFHKAPATDINPDEAIAVGAALTATMEQARRSGDASPVALRTRDVTSHTLGLAVVRDGSLHNLHVIGRNTRIPAERAREDITTSYDGQTSIDLWLVQGESEDPLASVVLGHFEFHGIPPRPAGQTRIGVTYRYTADAIVEVEALDLATGQVLPFRLISGGATLSDVAHRRGPLQLLLAVDCSGSMIGQAFRDARDIANTIINDVLTAPGRKVGVVSYPGGLRQMPTDDRERLQEVLDALHPAGRTPLADALERADAAVRPEPGTPRTLVILTDGHLHADNSPTIARRLREGGARVFAVGVGPQADPHKLTQLTASPTDAHLRKPPPDLGDGFANLATWQPHPDTNGSPA